MSIYNKILFSCLINSRARHSLYIEITQPFLILSKSQKSLKMCFQNHKKIKTKISLDCIAMISMYKSEVCNIVYWIIISQLPLTTLVVQALSCKFMLDKDISCVFIFSMLRIKLSCNGISMCLVLHDLLYFLLKLHRFLWISKSFLFQLWSIIP